MISSTISFIVPLAEAGKNCRSGEKATTLARLLAAGYSSPRGIVLTSDAYCYHLWESGCQDPASAAASSTTRNRTASSIRTRELAPDVAAALETAYSRLALQAGEEHPEVVVRLSPVGGGREHGGCIMGVRGASQVAFAIRELWASMWDHPDLSTRSGPPPDAAVIVQQRAHARLFGRVSTADESTGNPLFVRVTCGPEPTGKRPYGIEVNLDGWAVKPISPESEDLMDDLRMVADRAVLIENLLGGRIRIDWAIGPDGLWILDAKPLRSLPIFFPGLDSIQRPFVALTDRPVGGLSESLIARSRSNHTARACPEHLPLTPSETEGGGVPLLDSGSRGARPTGTTTVVNGYVFGCGLASTQGFLSEAACPEQVQAVPPPNPLRNGGGMGRCSIAVRKEGPTDWRLLARELSRAAQLAEEWGERVSPDIGAAADALIEADLSALAMTDLKSLVRRAEDACRTARLWSEKVWSPADRFLSMLPNVLSDCTDSDVKVLGRGIPYPTIERDSSLHQLGELFFAGEEAGKIEVPDWWRAFRGEVSSLAREYGYAFAGGHERYDLARWRSWIEDAEPLYRMIKALSHRTNRSSLVLRHSAAALEAEQAAARINELLHPRQRATTEQLIWAARNWPAKACECDTLLSRGLASLRLGALEIGRRLVEEGAVALADEVFELTVDELTELPREYHSDRREESPGISPAGQNDTMAPQIARAVADARHRRWLNERLTPPRDEPTQPPVAVCERSQRDEKVCLMGRARGDSLLSGRGNGCGKALGRVRVVRDMTDGGELSPGDVLVVDSAESGWWALLANAGALVSERCFPGDLSGLISCEYGVPCVSGCSGATTLMPDGRQVQVDSDTGTVEWGLR